jgi:hypothetical protein|tara:strand:- start:674 stop:1111 length:438 start_codon:yes stop_codon:yes gene_type:complete
MNFKQYLSQTVATESGQAIATLTPNGLGAASISNPRVRADINLRLSRELVEVRSPYSGIQTVRKVLGRHALDIPTLYDLNPQEDELTIELNQFGNELSVEEYSMYILYYLADDGTYDFYAEAIDNESLDEILADEEVDEDELELE